jgi:ribonuclease VapC
VIVETSAIVSIAEGEPASDLILQVLKDSVEVKRMSAASYLEAAIVLDARNERVLSNRLDELVKSLLIQIEPVTESQANIAREAYRNFGRGSGHRASLNFGDCFAYALAKETGERVLFLGDDFNHTDLYAFPY